MSHQPPSGPKATTSKRTHGHPHDILSSDNAATLDGYSLSIALITKQSGRSFHSACQLPCLAFCRRVCHTTASYRSHSFGALAFLLHTQIHRGQCAFSFSRGTVGRLPLSGDHVRYMDCPSNLLSLIVPQLFHIVHPLACACNMVVIGCELKSRRREGERSPNATYGEAAHIVQVLFSRWVCG